VQQASYFFDCDTAAARFSTWSRTVDRSFKGLSGTMKFVEVRNHEEWNPAATILLGGSSDTEFAGFRIIRSLAPQGDLLVEFIGQHAPEGLENLGVISSSTGPIPFEVRYHGVTASFRFGRIVKVVDAIGFPVSEVSLGCSTAEVKFDGVQVH
jgi:hypothetical protein